MAKHPLRALYLGIAVARRFSSASAPVLTAAKVASVEAEEGGVPQMKTPVVLYRRLSALGHEAGGSVAGTMDEWLREGMLVTEPQVMNYVRELRRYKRHQLALDIVAMHGFLKLQRHKESILEALESVDLLRPTRRSTVQDRARMAAGSLTLEEVKRDVVALGWEDCFLGSVVSVEPGKEAPPKAATGATGSGRVSKRGRRGGGGGVSRKRLLSATTALLSLAAAPAE